MATELDYLKKDIEGHVFDYSEWAGVSKCRHPEHISGYSSVCWKASVDQWLKKNEIKRVIVTPDNAQEIADESAQTYTRLVRMFADAENLGFYLVARYSPQTFSTQVVDKSLGGEETFLRDLLRSDEYWRA